METMASRGLDRFLNSKKKLVLCHEQQGWCGKTEMFASLDISSCPKNWYKDSDNIICFLLTLFLLRGPQSGMKILT